MIFCYHVISTSKPALSRKIYARNKDDNGNDNDKQKQQKDAMLGDPVALQRPRRTKSRGDDQRVSKTTVAG